MLRTCLSKTFSIFNVLTKPMSTFVRPTTNLDNPNSNEHYIALEYDHGCHNPLPIPVVLKEGKGPYVWDVTGKQYLDFMCSYGALNHGHCHPKILEAMVEQAKKLTLTSSVTHHDQLGKTYQYMSKTFGFDKAIMMNGGVEGSETAVLIARRWAYAVKGVPENQAKMVFPIGNYWGKSIAARAGSEDTSRRKQFGPFGGLNFELIPYDDVNAIESLFKQDPYIAAFLLEPIQGQGGVVHPKEGYLKKVRELCTKYNVLMVVDEIQTGLGRTGKLVACDWEEVKPDLLVLGKSLSGGYYATSAVLGKKEVMDVIKPGEHETTYGGNPIAAAVSKRAVELLFEEKLIENSEKLGNVFAKEFPSLAKTFSINYDFTITAIAAPTSIPQALPRFAIVSTKVTFTACWLHKATILDVRRGSAFSAT